MTVLIAGGGTGGHVYPMLAVGQAIERATQDAQVFYVGTSRGLEARVIPGAGCDLEVLDIAPLRGGGARGFARGLYKSVASFKACRDLVKRRRPNVVLSVGGYAGGPVALAARAMGVPLAILEPNGVLGLTNRLLKPFAKRAYVAFGDLDRSFKNGVAIRTGVPLRSVFAAKPYAPTPGKMRVLVLGGSLGAKALNERVPAAIARVMANDPTVEVVHQTGRNRLNETLERYAAVGLAQETAVHTGRVRVIEFIDSVAEELEAADVVLQRCGASSLAELCTVGRASILVPYPFASDQHQLANARSLEAAGAAIALPQTEATSDKLAELLLGLASSPERRTEMAARARSLGAPDAADNIARDLLGLAHGGA